MANSEGERWTSVRPASRPARALHVRRIQLNPASAEVRTVGFEHRETRSAAFLPPDDHVSSIETSSGAFEWAMLARRLERRPSPAADSAQV